MMSVGGGAVSTAQEHVGFGGRQRCLIRTLTVRSADGMFWPRKFLYLNVSSDTKLALMLPKPKAQTDERQSSNKIALNKLRFE